MVHSSDHYSPSSAAHSNFASGVPKDNLDIYVVSVVLWYLSNFTPSTSVRMFSQVMLDRRTATVIYGMSYTFTYLVKAAPIAASVHFNLEISESFCPP